MMNFLSEYLHAHQSSLASFHFEKLNSLSYSVHINNLCTQTIISKSRNIQYEKVNIALQNQEAIGTTG